MITVINSKTGNFLSVVNMLKKIGQETILTDDYDLISKSKIIIFPGVGNFDNVMENVYEKKIDKAILNSLEKNSKLLGICVGMQIMGDTSEEGSMPGLGWIPGNIQKLPKKCPRLPHMGWNLISIRKKHKLFLNLDEDARFYFLHSYYFSSLDQSNILSETNYNFDFVSSIHNNNIYGIQFHPEKSHRAGCQLLKNFAEL